MIISIIILVIILAIILYRERGRLRYFNDLKTERDKIRIENALKYIYDCEYEKGAACSTEAIAGNFNMALDKTIDVVNKLESMNLIRTKERRIILEPEGKKYALRVIRTHRLWEKYLADQTGTSELEWHQKADQIEHKLSFEEVENIAARIGNPLVDPHGDPIPTVDGEIRKLGGMPVTMMNIGDVGKVVHVEDEPKAIYSQLINFGIHKGMQIEMLNVSNEKIRFMANGKVTELTPNFANNITIKKIDKTQQRKSFISLNTLKRGETAEVVEVSEQLRGQQRRRLMDFGFLPGTKIKVGIKSPFGNPTGYIIRDTTIALRNDQADKIFIKLTENQE